MNRETFPVRHFFTIQVLIILFSDCRSHNSPAKKITTQIPVKVNNWVFHTGPWFRPFVSCKSYPYVWTFGQWNFEQSWSILQFHLGVCRYCNSCLSFTIWQFWNYIHNFRSGHFWRRRSLLCEYSISAWVIFNNVPVLCTSEVSVPTPFFKWQMSINDAKWTFFFVFVCFKNDLFLASNFLQFPSWNRLKFLPFLEHGCFCIKNFEPNCDDSPMYILGLQCDPHGALVETVPPFVWWIRETQLCNHISILGPFQMQMILVPVSAKVHSPCVPVAKNYVCSVFYKAWQVSFKFLIFSSHSSSYPDIPHHWDQRNKFLSFVEHFPILGFFNCPFLFFPILRGFPILDRSSGHTRSGVEVVWNFVSLTTRPHIPFVSFNNVNFVNPVHESDTLLFKINIPIIVGTLLFFWRPNQCVGEKEMFLLSAHRVQLEVHCDGDRWSLIESFKNRHGLQSHLQVGYVETLPVRLEILPWGFLSPYGLIPPWSGFSEFVVSSWQFCCTICELENKFVFFLTDQYLLGVSSSRTNYWCISVSQFF